MRARATPTPKAANTISQLLAVAYSSLWPTPNRLVGAPTPSIATHLSTHHMYTFLFK